MPTTIPFDPTSDPYGQLAVDLHQCRDSPRRTVESIVTWAQKFADCTGAGVMLLHAGRQVDSAAASSPAIQDAQEIQLALGEGPCVESALGRSSGSYVTQAAGDDRRHATWGPTMAQIGLHSVLTVPLGTEERHFGSLNLYSSHHAAFGRDDVAAVEGMARHASIAYANAQECGGLRAAIDTRKVIGQAQGVLMERFDLDAQAAFEFLRRQSQGKNVKLRVVAGWIVANRRNRAVDVGGPDWSWSTGEAEAPAS